jgi:8-oxo-dGTP pyrophosphatase MutT (NUDIX family)
VSFEKIGSEEIWSGKIATVRVDRVRFDDGEEADREVVAHPGAVGIVAHDGERLYLVRQPREAVGEQSLLELPAGKLEDEEPLETAKRELAEEIGKGAETWEYMTSFWTSPGFADEKCHLYLATDLYDHSEDSGEDERIEIVTVPFEELGKTIEDCRDSKTLVGLLWFERTRA